MINEKLKEARAVREYGTTTMIEHAESLLQHDVVLAVYVALLKSGPTAGLDREPLGAVMAGESHPSCVKDALADARKRLEARDALTQELVEAIDHVIEFLTNRRAIITRCKEIEKSSPGMADIERLMQKLVKSA